jgi:benzoylformate decarboxylase
VLGHVQPSLRMLAAELTSQATTERRAQAAQRAGQYAGKHRAARGALRAAAARERDARPMTPLTLMSSLADILPPDIAVVEEAVTTTNTTFERLGALQNTTGYFGHRGWALGWGLGVAIGAKLAWPERPVLALLGEGAAGYGMQGLWSAARYQIPVTFVICNNAQYQILKIGAQGLQLPQALAGQYEGLDLVAPEVDFVGLAQALGVEALRVSEPEELRERVRGSFERDRPLLIDVPLARETPNRLQYG